VELKEAVEKRRSIRAFKEKEVEEEKLEYILTCANLAPSAGNLQARDFVVVKSKEMRKKVARAALSQEFVEEAPVVIVMCANINRSAAKYGWRGAKLYCIVDAALAAQNLMLACVDADLGSCYVGAFDDDEIRKILNLPDYVIPVGIIPLGYPDEAPEPAPRLPLKRIVHYEKW